jgi:hypothetical protein
MKNGRMDIVVKNVAMIIFVKAGHITHADVHGASMTSLLLRIPFFIVAGSRCLPLLK